MASASTKCVCARDFKQPVQIYRIVESVDSSGFGEAIPTSVLVASPTVKIEPQLGREFFRASQVYPTMTHLITMRYRSGITTKMRVVLKGRNLNVIGIVNEMEENKVLRLACVEAV